MEQGDNKPLSQLLRAMRGEHIGEPKPEVLIVVTEGYGPESIRVFENGREIPTEEVREVLTQSLMTEAGKERLREAVMPELSRMFRQDLKGAIRTVSFLWGNEGKGGIGIDNE